MVGANRRYRADLVRARNSPRDRASVRKFPRRALVTVRDPRARTPRSLGPVFALDRVSQRGEKFRHGEFRPGEVDTGRGTKRHYVLGSLGSHRSLLGSCAAGRLIMGRQP